MSLIQRLENDTFATVRVICYLQMYFPTEHLSIWGMKNTSVENTSGRVFLLHIRISFESHLWKVCQ